MLNQKQKRTVLFALLTLPYLFLSACDSKEQKALNAQREAQASANAQNYIQKKYGFSADVTEAKVERRPGMFCSTPLSDVFVQMTHDGQDFTVYISGESETDAGCDDYQAEAVRDALAERIEAEIPGLRLLDPVPRQKTDRDTGLLLFSAFFDGSNLQEMLSDGIRSFRAYYVQTDFSDAKQFTAPERFFGTECGTEADFISCRSDEILSADAVEREWAAAQPVYCDNYRRLGYTADSVKKDGCYYAYTLHQYGDFYYYVNDKLHYDEGQSLTELPQISDAEPVGTALFNGYGATNAEAATKACTLNAGTKQYVHLYYPCSRIDRFDDSFSHDKTRFGSIVYRDGQYRCSADPVRIVRDYCYACIELNPDEPYTFLFLSCP